LLGHEKVSIPEVDVSVDIFGPSFGRGVFGQGLRVGNHPAFRQPLTANSRLRQTLDAGCGLAELLLHGRVALG